MKKAISKKKLIVILVFALLILIGTTTGFVAFAAYTKSSRAKRVISASGEEGMLFSSNYMQSTLQGNGYNKKTIHTGNADSPVAANLTVCNYSQKNRGTYYNLDIVYSLSAKLMYQINSHDYRDATSADVGAKTVKLSIAGQEITLNSSTLSYTPSSGEFYQRRLNGGIEQTDSFLVTFHQDFNIEGCKLCLYVKAEPVGLYQNISPIDTILSTSVSTSETSLGWTGNINETAENPNTLDGYNYLIQGAGNGTVRLSWNEDYLLINQLFVIDTIEQTIQDGDDNWKYVEFAVDSSQVNRYEIQFYKPSKDVTFTSWDELLSKIIFSYNPS